MKEREEVKFDFAYRFYKGDDPASHLPGALALGAGAQAVPAAAWPEFEDSAWELIDVPHDMNIRGDYDQSADPGGIDYTYLPRSNGWYWKHFNLPGEYNGSSVWLDFEGMWQAFDMFLNGVPLPDGTLSPYLPPAGWPTTGSGYLGFNARLDNVTGVKV